MTDVTEIEQAEIDRVKERISAELVMGAWKRVMKALAPLDDESRRRVLKAAAVLLFEEPAR